MANRAKSDASPPSLFVPNYAILGKPKKRERRDEPTFRKYFCDGWGRDIGESDCKETEGCRVDRKIDGVFDRYP